MDHESWLIEVENELRHLFTEFIITHGPPTVGVRPVQNFPKFLMFGQNELFDLFGLFELLGGPCCSVDPDK